MISDKDKLNLIVKIISEIEEYPPDGDSAYVAVLTCIDVVANYEGESDAS